MIRPTRAISSLCGAWAINGSPHKRALPTGGRSAQERHCAAMDAQRAGGGRVVAAGV